MFFNDTATTEIDPYLHTLSLHDALPIYAAGGGHESRRRADRRRDGWRDLQYQRGYHGGRGGGRSRRVAAISADGRGGRAGQAKAPADRPNAAGHRRLAEQGHDQRRSDPQAGDRRARERGRGSSSPHPNQTEDRTGTNVDDTETTGERHK